MTLTLYPSPPSPQSPTHPPCRLQIFIIVFSLLGPIWYWALTLALLYIHPLSAGMMTGCVLAP